MIREYAVPPAPLLEPVLATISAAQLGQQAWTKPRGAERWPDPLYMKPPTGGWVKPMGGFWTSTYHPEHGSGWVQYCLSEYSPGDITYATWVLDPMEQAQVYVIDTVADLNHLVERFPARQEAWHLAGDRYVNWSLAARACDAVHLTERGQWATRHSMPCDLYGWDCESTVWLRWCFERVAFLGDRTFRMREAA